MPLSPLEQLARDRALAGIDAAPQPVVFAAELARQIVLETLAASKPKISAEETVRHCCHGVLTALLLKDKPLHLAAVEMLDRLAHASQDLHVDPTEMMTWTLSGIALLSASASPQAMHAIQEAIGAKFMGAGEVFRELCRQSSAGR